MSDDLLPPGTGEKVESSGTGIGLVAVSAAVTLMGIGSVIAKAADIDGPRLAFNRAWGACVIYVLALYFLRGKITRRKLRLAAPGGLIFGVQLAFFFSSIQLTTVANATMLIALQPVAVLLIFSRRFGETVTSRALLLSVLAVAGVGIVLFGSTDSPSWSPLGDALGVCTLGSWTLYFVWSKRARVHLGAFEYQAMSLVFSSIVLLPIALIFGGGLDPTESAGSEKWLWILAMIAVPGTGHLLLNWAHARVDLSLVSQLTLASPVVSIALAAAVLQGETVNVVQIVGMVIVLSALGGIVRSDQKARPRPQQTRAPVDSAMEKS